MTPAFGPRVSILWRRIRFRHGVESFASRGSRCLRSSIEMRLYVACCLNPGACQAVLGDRESGRTHGSPLAAAPGVQDTAGGAGRFATIRLVQRALDFHVAGLAAYTWSQRPDLAEGAETLEPEVWPEYNLHGDVVGAYWSRLREVFFRLPVRRRRRGGGRRGGARGSSIPCAWNGTIEGPPAGIDGAIEGRVRLRGTGEPPTGTPPPGGAVAIGEVPEGGKRESRRARP